MGTNPRCLTLDSRGKPILGVSRSNSSLTDTILNCRKNFLTAICIKVNSPGPLVAGVDAPGRTAARIVGSRIASTSIC